MHVYILKTIFNNHFLCIKIYGEDNSKSIMHGSCIIYCCITNFPKIEQLQTTNIYYFMIPLCQESGHGLAWCLCPKSLLKLWPNCWPGLLSSQGYTGPGDCAFQLTRMALGRPQSLPMWLTSQYLTVLYSKVGSFPQDKQSERGHSS